MTTVTVSFTNAADGQWGGSVLTTVSSREKESTEHSAGISEQGVIDGVGYEPRQPEPKAIPTDKTVDEENKVAGEESESTDEDDKSVDEECTHSDDYCSDPDCCDPALAWHTTDVIQDMRSRGLDVDGEGYWYHPGSFYVPATKPKGVVFEEE